MPSRSHGQQADSDKFAFLRGRLGELGQMTAEWAGIPMPIDGERLIIEPSYPWAAALSGKPEPDENDDWTLVNKWYSHKHRSDILLMRKDGKTDWGKLPACHHLSNDLRTLGCSVAWGMEQEAKALELLASLIRPHHFKQYMLTGMFLETSRRSKVTYLFRRLKPTVALSMRGDSPRVLAALCMHPIAYYADSWAGAMCPTDDVIAHLQMMRGDEHMFWKRSNQRPAYRPEAGL